MSNSQELNRWITWVFLIHSGFRLIILLVSQVMDSLSDLTESMRKGHNSTSYWRKHITARQGSSNSPLDVIFEASVIGRPEQLMRSCGRCCFWKQGKDSYWSSDWQAQRKWPKKDGPVPTPVLCSANLFPRLSLWASSALSVSIRLWYSVANLKVLLTCNCKLPSITYFHMGNKNEPIKLLDQNCSDENEAFRSY
jgi:hypothetical protein